MARTSPNPPILCFGEVLWDALPEGLFLGGAPLNVAAHLHQLGDAVEVVTRVGRDELGREIERRLHARHLPSRFLQWDDQFDTGFVGVRLDESGSPCFEIFAPSAWDRIEYTDELMEEAGNFRAILFGTLAQRAETSRKTLHQLLELDLPKVLDINIRPPFMSRDLVEKSLTAATILKLNTAELAMLADWFALPSRENEALAVLGERHALEAIILTRAGEGAAYWSRGTTLHVKGPDVKVADAVGAGDAFLAMFLHVYLGGGGAGEALRRANALGGWVATQRGATPVHDSAAVEALLAQQRFLPLE